MKKIIALLCIIALIIVNVMWFTRPSSSKDNTEETVQEDIIQEDIIQEDIVQDEINKEQKTEEAEVNSSMFYYHQLSDDNKIIYEEIYNHYLNLSESFIIELNDSDQLSKIHYSILYDHPELFWVNSYSYSITGTECKITPIYTYNKKEISSIEAAVQKEVNNLMNTIEDSDDDYTKILKTSLYLSELIEYDDYAADNDQSNSHQNIDTAFIDKETVCAGYAKALQYLLNSMNIYCTYVTGDATNSEGTSPHAWNLVKLNNEYYYIDVTWMDNDIVDYTYFMCGDDTLFKTHKLSNEYIYPSCTDNYYYYKINGLYIEDFNKDSLTSLLNNQISKHEKQISIACADKDVYSKTLNMIKNIYDYIDDQDTIKNILYYDKEAQLTITIVIEYK